jgi:hypothetical protein
MKRTPILQVAILGALLTPVSQAAPGTGDTTWGSDLSEELPADVRTRLRQLKQNAPTEKTQRSAPESRRDLKGQRERFLQSLPEAERTRLRQKIHQFEERPVPPRGPHDFRDR